MIYQVETAFVVDGNRFLQAFGAMTPPVGEAARRTPDRYRAGR